MFKLSRAILLVNIDMSIVNIIACLPSSPPSNNCLGYQTQTPSQSKLSSRPFQTSSPAIRYVRIIKQGFCSHRCWKVLAEGFLPRLAPAIVESEICRIIQIVGNNLRIVARWWTLCKSHLLRLCFGVFQPSLIWNLPRRFKVVKKLTAWSFWWWWG